MTNKSKLSEAEKMEMKLQEKAEKQAEKEMADKLADLMMLSFADLFQSLQEQKIENTTEKAVACNGSNDDER